MHEKQGMFCHSSRNIDGECPLVSSSAERYSEFHSSVSHQKHRARRCSRAADRPKRADTA